MFSLSCLEQRRHAEACRVDAAAEALEHAAWPQVVRGQMADDLFAIAAPRSSPRPPGLDRRRAKARPSFARTTAHTASSSKISSKAAAWSAGTNGLARVSASKAALSASTSLMKCSSGSTIARSAGVSQTSRQARPYNASWPRDASS